MGDNGIVNIPNVKVNELPGTTVQAEVWLHILLT
jgi:hypothetical protein